MKANIEWINDWGCIEISLEDKVFILIYPPRGGYYLRIDKDHFSDEIPFSKDIDKLMVQCDMIIKTLEGNNASISEVKI